MNEQTNPSYKHLRHIASMHFDEDKQVQVILYVDYFTKISTAHGYTELR